MQLFEAARWAPSSSNSQPWRFVNARAGTDHFAPFLDLLVDANKAWCVRAGALVVIVSKETFDNGSPSRTHSFDAGAAWMSLALQAQILGLVAHGMAGFDYERAAALVGLPEGYAVEAMCAIGHPGNVDDLPERYRAREVPSGRRPAAQSVFEGKIA